MQIYENFEGILLTLQKDKLPHMVFQPVRMTSKLVDIYKRQDVGKLTTKISTHPQRPSDALKLADPMNQTVSQASPLKRPKYGPEYSFA